MRILWIGGDHSRHLFYANTIHEFFPLCGAIFVRRENIIPAVPDAIQEIDKINYTRHFKEREEAERKYYGIQRNIDIPTLERQYDSLNSNESILFIRELCPDIVFIFGTGLVKEPLSSILPRNTINLHLGLSPRYRGSATLFWPFYFMEPFYSGVTFHYIISEPDAGDIIHQAVPELTENDGIHDVACKAVIQASQEVLKLLELIENGKDWKRYKQTATGKNFLTKDFEPHHLRIIYNVFNNDLIKQCLQGKLKYNKPRLIQQF